MARFNGREKFIKELWRIFLKDASHRMKKIREAYKESNINLLNIHAHSLSGSSRNAGAKLLSDVSSQVSLAAREGDIKMCNALFEGLEYEFNRVVTALQSCL